MKVLLCSPYEPVIKENAGGIAMWAKHIMDFYKGTDDGVDIASSKVCHMMPL